MPTDRFADAPLRASTAAWLNVTVGIGHFLVLFNTGAYLPMIPRVGGSLGVDPAFIDWTQANFFLAMALAFATASLWTNSLGARRVILGAFVVFAAASAVCGTTGNYRVFLLARMVQGYAGGITIPVSLVILLRHYTPAKRHIGLTLWGVAAITPFTLGPAVGGWITDALGWRWLFHANIIASLLTVLLLATFLPPDTEAPTPTRTDWPGLLALTAGLIALQSACNLGEVRDWLRAPAIVELLIGGGIALAYFAVWSWSAPNAILDLRLLARRNFLIGGLGLLLTAIWFQGLLALYVVQFQISLGYSAWRVGLLLLPMAVFSKITSVATHRTIQRADPRLIGAVALAGLALGSFWIASYDRNASFDALLWPQVLAGIFLGALFPPFAAIALSGLRGAPELRGAAFLNTLRACGQALGIPLITVLWERRRILHRHFLDAGDAFTNTMLHRAARALGHYHMTRIAARAHLVQAIAHHGALLAFNEAFSVGGYAFSALAVFLLLARRPVFAEPDTRVQKAIEELVEP